MIKNINSLKLSAAILSGSALVLAMAIFVSVPKAHAQAPYILAGSDLTVGSSGQGVVMLQGLLSEMGYLSVPTGVPFGYYGPLTKNAVGKYQASLGVAPTAGYYGPITKLAMYDDFASHNWLRLLGWQN